MEMELRAARMATWARVVERALHDRGPWTLRTLSGVTPAHRLIDREAQEIVFVGVTPPCPDGVVELWAGGDAVTLTRTDSGAERKITWRLSLKETASAC